MPKAAFVNSRQKNLHIIVEVKKEGRDTELRSVFTKDDKSQADKDFVAYHLPKS